LILKDLQRRVLQVWILKDLESQFAEVLILLGLANCKRPFTDNYIIHNKDMQQENR